jgi:pimeloyl-ACP methyl ester carboxylesterase
MLCHVDVPSVGGVRRRELVVQGLRTRVHESGAGDADEAIVLIHGGPGSANDWDDLLPRVAAFSRGIALDLPGFGAADKPADHWGYTTAAWAVFIGGALRELGVRRVHLLAHDLGGEAAVMWGLANPDAFASAILINTGVLIGYRWHLIGRLHRAPVLGQLAALAGGVGLRPAMRLYEPALPATVLKRWRREYDRGTRRAMLRFYRVNPPRSTGRLAGDLRRLDRPALVIWGGRNRFVPVAQAERQRESFPRAEVAVLPHAGHYPHLQDPPSVANLVLPFLERQLVPVAA